MKKLTILMILGIFLLLNCTVCADEYTEYIQELNTPEWVRDLLDTSKLNTKYAFIYTINPFYLRGDFNGDKSNDVAILIKETKTNKAGIAIFHSTESKPFILGAGLSFGNGDDDFKWITNWHVKRKPKAAHEVVFIEKIEAASAVLEWDGKKYLWKQAGN